MFAGTGTGGRPGVSHLHVVHLVSESGTDTVVLGISIRDCPGLLHLQNCTPRPPGRVLQAVNRASRAALSCRATGEYIWCGDHAAGTMNVCMNGLDCAYACLHEARPDLAVHVVCRLPSPCHRLHEIGTASRPQLATRATSGGTLKKHNTEAQHLINSLRGCSACDGIASRTAACGSPGPPCS